MDNKPRIGFLTYDLQEFTADCLSRVNDLAPGRLKAYPILPRVAAGIVNFPYRASKFEARNFTVSAAGSTPEGMMASVNWKAAVSCAWENDVVVLFGIQGGTAILLTALARLLGRRVISVNQTLPPACEKKRRWWIRWLKGWILRRCHVHVIETPAARETLAEVYHLSPRGFVEAPFEAGFHMFQQFAAQIRESRDELRRKLSLPGEECVFLFVGTMLRLKGIATILEAARLLHAKTSAFRVVFCGPDGARFGDPSLDDYRAMTRRLKIDDRVDFMGNRPLEDLARFYLASDALLLPTQKDCWPKVLVEAAACRLPLVTTTSCGASGSLVVTGQTGYVIPPADPQALANAMESLLNPDLRRTMGQNAFDFCQAFCDPVRQAHGFTEAIRRAA